jgi:HEAT repeat protein
MVGWECPTNPREASGLDPEAVHYVRARCAETLGYVGVDHPSAVGGPDILAELRVGLAFDESEVREKLAKALAHVAIGDPERLRHHVDDIAAHFDDENELVRYHLTTALVLVGTTAPDRLAEASGPLRERLTDPNPYVRGRAAEAIGLGDTVDAEAALGELRDSDESFVSARAAFATGTDASAAAAIDATDDPLGTVASVEATTEHVAEAIAKPDDNGDCPHCGCSLPGDGPPMCPQCGAPR